jgi:hypothetical protein
MDWATLAKQLGGHAQMAPKAAAARPPTLLSLLVFAKGNVTCPGDYSLLSRF